MSEKEKEELSLALHKKLSYFCLAIASLVWKIVSFLTEFFAKLVVTLAFIIAFGFMAIVAYKLHIGELIIIMAETSI